jgi:hypothetical protein
MSLVDKKQELPKIVVKLDGEETDTMLVSKSGKYGFYVERKKLIKHSTVFETTIKSFVSSDPILLIPIPANNETIYEIVKFIHTPSFNSYILPPDNIYFHSMTKIAHEFDIKKLLPICENRLLEFLKDKSAKEIIDWIPFSTQYFKNNLSNMLINKCDKVDKKDRDYVSNYLVNIKDPTISANVIQHLFNLVYELSEWAEKPVWSRGPKPGYEEPKLFDFSFVFK